MPSAPLSPLFLTSYNLVICTIVYTDKIIIPIKKNTNFFWKYANSINVFFISSIGPNTRNARSAFTEKTCPKDAAINASADEQMDKT